MSKENKIIIALLFLIFIGLIFTNINLKPYSITTQNVQATITGRDYKDVDDEKVYYIAVEYADKGEKLQGKVEGKDLYDSSQIGKKISLKLLTYKYKDGRNTKTVFTK